MRGRSGPRPRPEIAVLLTPPGGPARRKRSTRRSSSTRCGSSAATTGRTIPFPQQHDRPAASPCCATASSSSPARTETRSPPRQGPGARATAQCAVPFGKRYPSARARSVQPPTPHKFLRVPRRGHHTGVSGLLTRRAGPRTAPPPSERHRVDGQSVRAREGHRSGVDQGRVQAPLSAALLARPAAPRPGWSKIKSSLRAAAARIRGALYTPRINGKAERFIQTA
jgi:hypothetical protein